MKRVTKLYLIILLMVVSFNITIISRYCNSQEETVMPDSNQYYGEIVAIANAGDGRIIDVAPAATPYPQHDQLLLQQIELIVPATVSLTARIGPNGEVLDIQLGELERIYNDLTVGDKIAFRITNWIADDRVAVEKIIFTGED